MPARGTLVADALPARILAFMEAKPGYHRAAEIADELGATDPVVRQRLANCLGRMARRGQVVRRVNISPGNSRGVTEFSLRTRL